MRIVVGDARLVATPTGYALEAPGLQYPAALIATAAGDPLPDLSAAVGQICNFSGLLQTPGANLNLLALLVTDLNLPQQPLAAPGPLYATVSGRLGKQPEANRASSPDWYSGSLCYDSPEDRNKASSWIRIQCRTYFSIADRFIELETGALISATGPLESWQTAEGKHRCALSLRGFDRSGARSYAAQSAPSQSLVTSAAPADAGLAPAELLDAQPADEDAFVGASA
jgi:hypothetical protein